MRCLCTLAVFASLFGFVTLASADVAPESEDKGCECSTPAFNSGAPALAALVGLGLVGARVVRARRRR